MQGGSGEGGGRGESARRGRGQGEGRTGGGSTRSIGRCAPAVGSEWPRFARWRFGATGDKEVRGQGKFWTAVILMTFLMLRSQSISAFDLLFQLLEQPSLGETGCAHSTSSNMYSICPLLKFLGMCLL